MKKLDEEISKTSNYNYNKYLVRSNDYQKTENKVYFILSLYSLVYSSYSHKKTIPIVWKLWF